MTIKHLVISGGGPLGLRYFGALKHLHNIQYWNMNDIQSIYGTSIGAIIGAVICLKHDFNIIEKYIVERPWDLAFKLSAKQIFQSYYNKGLYDKSIIETIFKPLLEAKDLNINITLLEFYQFTNIDLHIFAFELNSYTTIEFNHHTHPNYTLIDCLTMSAALPGIFMPVFIDNLCFIDGGLMNNFPINECIRDHPNKEQILAIKSESNFKSNITHESSLLDYIMSITLNSMNFIKNTVKIDTIDNIIICQEDNQSSFSLDNINKSISDSIVRQNWIDDGENDAIYFLYNNNYNL